MNKNKIETQTKTPESIKQMAKEAAKSAGKYGIKTAKIHEMRFIGVEFDYRKVKIGEELVNKAISQGFQPLRDYETNSGLVIIMARWEDGHCQCNE
jgi:N-acetylglutamate synthase-like GNAT family acetyltransferase